MKRKLVVKTMLKPLEFKQRVPPYQQLLSGDYPPNASAEEILDEMEARNAEARRAMAIENEIIAKLEAGELPQLEARITQAVLYRLRSKVVDVLETLIERE